MNRRMISFILCITYYVSIIRFSHVLLAYGFFCTLFSHSSVYGTAIGPYFFGLTFLYSFFCAIGLLLDRFLYKEGYIYVDRYVVLIVAYLASAFLSSVVAGAFSKEFSFQIDAFRTLLLPAVVCIAVIQTLEFRHIAYIGRLFCLFMIFNFIVNIFQIPLHWEYRAELGSAFSGLFTDRNLYARFLVIVSAYLLIRILSQNRISFIDKRTFLFGLCVLIISLLYSRSGYILFIVSTGLIVWRSNRKKMKRYAVIVGLFFLVPLFGFQTYQRMIRTGMIERNVSDLGRISTIKAGINMIKDKPMFGVGYRMSSPLFSEYEEKKQIGAISTIHNIYIAVFAEQGIIGLAVFLLLHFGLLWQLFIRIIRPIPFSYVQMELFCFISLSVLLIHGLVYHTLSYEGLYWLVLACCIIVLRDGEPDVHKEKAINTSRV